VPISKLSESAAPDATEIAASGESTLRNPAKAHWHTDELVTASPKSGAKEKVRFSVLNPVSWAITKTRGKPIDFVPPPPHDQSMEEEQEQEQEEEQEEEEQYKHQHEEHEQKQVQKHTHIECPLTKARAQSDGERKRSDRPAGRSRGRSAEKKTKAFRNTLQKPRWSLQRTGVEDPLATSVTNGANADAANADAASADAASADAANADAANADALGHHSLDRPLLGTVRRKPSIKTFEGAKGEGGDGETADQALVEATAAGTVELKSQKVTQADRPEGTKARAQSDGERKRTDRPAGRSRGRSAEKKTKAFRNTLQEPRWSLQRTSVEGASVSPVTATGAPMELKSQKVEM
jgi:hypothetical protein